MRERPRFWIIRGVLALAVLAGVSILLRLDLGRRVSTDVLDLIPAGERDPELAMVRALAGEQSARVALFALDVGAEAERRDRVEEVFVETLRRSDAFAEIVPMSDRSVRDELGRRLFERRFDLLLPGWLSERRREYEAEGSSLPWSEWLAERAAVSLENFLQRPEALGFQDLLPSDPLLLMAGLLDAMPPLPEPAAEGGPVLVWARTRESPMEEAGQQPVFAAVERALGDVRAIEPEVRLQWSAIARFAAESRARIQRELKGLNLLSLLAVFAAGAIALRQVLRAVHLVPVVLGGLLGAWLAVLLSFERVHVLVFVVGSLLAGVAVDYGIYLCLRFPGAPDEAYGARVRRLLKPLLASALTTILGFSLLLLSELPLIRQLGVFVSAGLLSSLATALLWFGQLPQPYVELRAFARARLPRSRRSRRAARIVLGGGALVAVAGLWTLRWHDDIRELEIPAPELRAEARAVQTLFGDRPGTASYLTHGANVAAARRALAQFQQWHDAQHPDARAASLGFLLPTAEDFEATSAQRVGLEPVAPHLRTALERHGFSAEAFDPFFDAWMRWRAEPRADYEAVVRGFAESLRGPLSLLVSVSGSRCWFVSMAPHAVGAEPPAATSTLSVRQLENLNRLFGRYRLSALQLSTIGLAVLGLSVVALYGWRHGWRVFAVPAGACLFMFGVLGLTEQTLNLFHLLGAFLGVCLSHNYAIFSAENARRQEEPPPSIRLSAVTTSASFGVLSLSAIPVVSALGTTVALVVLAALAIVELEPLARGAPAGPDTPHLP